MILISPSNSSILNIKIQAIKSGDLKKLSKTDIELIALTLELNSKEDNRVTLYTDDYTMENLCKKIGISYSSVFREGIKKVKSQN